SDGESAGQRVDSCSELGIVIDTRRPAPAAPSKPNDTVAWPPDAALRPAGPAVFAVSVPEAPHEDPQTIDSKGSVIAGSARRVLRHGSRSRHAYVHLNDRRLPW